MRRYRHPKHGCHIIGYGDDVAALEAAGWMPEPPPAAPEPPPAPDPAPVPEPTRREPWRPKRGR